MSFENGGFFQHPLVDTFSLRILNTEFLKCLLCTVLAFELNCLAILENLSIVSSKRALASPTVVDSS